MRSWLLLPLATVVGATVATAPPPAPVVGSPSSGAQAQVAAARVGSRVTSAARSGAESAAGATTAHQGAGSGVVPSAVWSTRLTAPRPELRPPGRWAWPLSPRPAVLRPFVRPVTGYGAGHRGIDLAGSSGQEVLAVDKGLVTHVGRIAGRGTVTVLHASGVRSTYEPVDVTVSAGAAVAAGTPLGQLAASGSHCEPACLHLGAVHGDAYLDPLDFLVGGRRVRLLPLGQAPDG